MLQVSPDDVKGGTIVFQVFNVGKKGEGIGEAQVPLISIRDLSVETSNSQMLGEITRNEWTNKPKLCSVEDESQSRKKSM